jgi:hypothetical protein
VLVSGVTDWPEAAELVTAGVEPGVPPAVTTKIWKVGGVAGAGVHWKAQPMFQVPPAMVNAGLVQLPACWVAGTSTVAGPAATGAAVVAVVPPAAVVAVVPPAAVVAVAPPAAVVAVAPPAAVVAVALPAAGGRA